MNLIKLLKQSTYELCDHLKPLASVTDGENYFYIPSKTACHNVLFMAHIDTVNKPDYKPAPVILSDCIINHENKPLGGDDRVGVLLSLHFHDQMDVPVLFTNYEETGGLGATEFIGSGNDLLLSDTELIVSIDRAGVSHYVSYDFDIPYWIDAFMKDIGLIEKHGTWSDCQTLTDYFNIPSINIACGYYGNHSRMEYINLMDVKKTMIYLQELINLSPLIDEYKTEYPETDYRINDDPWAFDNGYRPQIYDSWEFNYKRKHKKHKSKIKRTK